MPWQTQGEIHFRVFQHTQPTRHSTAPARHLLSPSLTVPSFFFFFYVLFFLSGPFRRFRFKYFFPWQYNRCITYYTRGERAPSLRSCWRFLSRGFRATATGVFRFIVSRASFQSAPIIYTTPASYSRFDVYSLETFVRRKQWANYWNGCGGGSR